MSSPTVSVVMPVYNAEPYLSQAIESILGQTRGDFELIVVDDGSTDASPGVLQHFESRDARVRILRQEHQGVVAALNRGCGAVNGRYVARMDADDVSLPERLERQVAHLEAYPTVDVLGCGYRVVAVDGTAMRECSNPTAHPLIEWEMAFRNCMCHPTVVMRREALEGLGGYRDEFLHCEDYDLWVRALECLRFANLPEVLLLYRASPGGICRSQPSLVDETHLRLTRRVVSRMVDREVTSREATALRGLVTGFGAEDPDRFDLARDMLLELRRRFLETHPLSPHERSAIEEDVARKLWDLRASARGHRSPLLDLPKMGPYLLEAGSTLLWEWVRRRSNAWTRNLPRLRGLLSTGSTYRALVIVVGLRLGLLAPARSVPADPPSREDVPRPVTEALPAEDPLSPLADPACIPRVIFQTWKSRDDIPPRYSTWRESLRRLNPDHAMLLWDDADNRAFIADHYPWFLDTYDRYPREIFRADMVRYFFLFHCGGIYVDMDTECLRPLDALLQRETSIVLGTMGADRAFPHSIPNAVMASPPREIFWLLVIARAMRRMAGRSAADLEAAGPEEVTGPILLRDTVMAYQREPWEKLEREIEESLGSHEAARTPRAPLLLLEPSTWYPMDWTNQAHKLLRRELNVRGFVLERAQVRFVFPEASLVTWWSHSW